MVSSTTSGFQQEQTRYPDYKISFPVQTYSRKETNGRLQNTEKKPGLAVAGGMICNEELPYEEARFYTGSY